MFTPTVFEVLLFEGRLVLAPTQWGTESKRVKFSVKNQKNIRLLLKLLKKLLTYKLRTFQMVSNFFFFCLTFSVPEKLKNLIFEIPITPQTLSINKQRTTSAKSIKLHIIRKLINQSLKNDVVRQYLLLLFSRYCCSKVDRYQHPPSGVQGAKGLIKIAFGNVFRNHNSCITRYTASCTEHSRFVIQALPSEKSKPILTNV